jgi:ribosomal protein S18 acetylase RimI-like enzyme
VRLRPATAADEPFLRKLDACVRTPIFASLEPSLRATLLEQQWHAKRVAQAHTRPDASEEIIELEGRAIGAITTDSVHGALELVDIAVLPELCGRGIGTAAIGELRGRALAGGRVLRLSVYRTNTRALALYQRLGFRQVAADELALTLELPAAASDTS